MTSCRISFLIGVTLLVLTLRAEPPAWWTEQGVLAPGATANDYAVANMGQAKNFGTKAVAEMNLRLAAHGGAGPALDQLVAAWRQPPAPGVVRNDFAALNLGQLKALAKPFYDRLAELSYHGPPLAPSEQYPWTITTADDHDYTPANLGQVKHVFSFVPALADVGVPGDTDRNGLPDAWEQQYFGHTGVDPNADPDGDGATNAQEYAAATDPVDFFNGETPVIKLIGGQNQPRASGYLPQPIELRVLHADGVTPWPNAPVTLSVDYGDGKWAASPSGAVSSVLVLRTGATGMVQAYYWIP